MEERISKIEDRNLEMTQVEERTRIKKKLYENYLTPLGQQKDNMYPRKRREGKGNRAHSKK